MNLGFDHDSSKIKSTSFNYQEVPPSTPNFPAILFFLSELHYY